MDSMRVIFNIVILVFGVTGLISAQQAYELIIPESEGWTVIEEGKTVAFQIRATPDVDSKVRFYPVDEESIGIELDSLGHFSWTPSYSLVNRLELKKDFSVIIQGNWPDGQRVRKTITFTVLHINRPPVVEELPVFYVKQSSRNIYQIASDYVYDPDEDPIVFKSIPSQMPEGLSLSSQGQLSWSPSRNQFNSLRSNPLVVEFIVQDQPDKAEMKGKLRIAQTQLDLPPEILMVPGDTSFSIKEDETINLKIYISDPNGDDNVLSAGFISSDIRVEHRVLKENTPLQYEFIWQPGYEFVDEAKKKLPVEFTFFALDKSNNRVQRKIIIVVNDTENLIEKDALQYQKYRNNLTNAAELLRTLDENQKKLNENYKKAKRGKKNRSVLNASLGAVTGFSPALLETDQSKVVSTVGGTTVLTLNTLEATEVVGKSKDDIMDKIKINVDIRNRVQSAGDEFARKYSSKVSRRSGEFEKDIDKLRTVLNDQRIVLLELDAYKKNAVQLTDKDLKRTFPDFTEEN
ncbi:MAG: hypothetical protein MUC73_07790 [Cyclobacteriaceae bacterium]|jgi:hypothetical protein|nr:hypothetical protein [Cyclobacteriaceae bacterium]